MCSTEKLKELLTLKEMKKEIETSIKEIEKEIYNDFSREKGTYYQDDLIIKINLVNRENLDSKRLKNEHISIYKMYVKQSQYNTIKIEVKA